MEWFLKKYSELSTDEFYQVLKLRIDIFVVEQNCPYFELDGKDKMAFHLMGFKEDKLIAYSRFFKPGDYYKEGSFGRVAVHKDFRGQKIAYKLIEEVLKNMKDLFSNAPVKIGAQTYLKKFYESFDFTQIDAAYVEDGIPHIYMLKPIH